MFARNTKQSVLAAAALMLGLTYASHCNAACTPQDVEGPTPKDPVFRLLAAQDSCPRNATELIDALKRSGARSEPTMVNFAGFHNPGAFFIFEIVTNEGAPPSGLTIARGDFLFGHFTTTRNGSLVPVQRGLMIELIAWDPDKQFYNFYDVVSSKWIYRGDSAKILDNVTLLHRRRDGGQAGFSGELRCSRCHVNGGLIQKELAPPHNDWFVQNRHLPLDKLKPDPFVQGRLNAMLDADELSKLVKASAQRLADSPKYQKPLAARTMQERLRPLFCPMELNIESDSEPVDDEKPALRVPSAFFADTRLATADISIDRKHYDAAVGKLKSQLPLPERPKRPDADHGWLTPVKANSDVVAVENLIRQGTVTREFAVAVLAVDFTNPVFSKARCDLLKLVPDQPGPDFVTRFEGALRGASGPAAAELLKNLTDPARNTALHQKQAAEFLQACQKRAKDRDAVLGWYRLLAQRRIEVSQNEISEDPDRHILEDPDRVVFPSTEPAAEAGQLALTLDCEVK